MTCTTATSLRRCLTWLMLAGMVGCGFDRDDEQTVLRWLQCEECIAGERDSVRVIGRSAVSYLSGVLDTVPPKILEPLRIRLTNSWTPQIHPDQDVYVAFYIENASAKARIRAAQALGDLGADRQLRQAITRAVDRGLRDDVVSALRGALAAAEQGSPVVSSVRILPDAISLAVGESTSLALLVEDEHDNLLAPDVAWGSSNPAVATVQDGRVTGVALGNAAIRAVSAADSSISATAAVTVAPGPQSTMVLNEVSGDGQTGPPGAQLPIALSVAVTANGVPIQGVAVSWKVLRGGGLVTPIGQVPGMTDGTGSAAATVRLGPAGPHRIEARIAGAPAVVFRATANTP